jgi:hypothetical protein
VTSSGSMLSVRRPGFSSFAVTRSAACGDQYQIDFLPLLQRIAFTVISRDGAYGSRINTSPLHEGEIFHPVSMK